MAEFIFWNGLVHNMATGQRGKTTGCTFWDACVHQQKAISERRVYCWRYARIYDDTFEECVALALRCQHSGTLGQSSISSTCKGEKGQFRTGKRPRGNKKGRKGDLEEGKPDF